MVGLIICLIGLIVTVTVKANGPKYAGLCILLFGSYISAPLTVVWLSGNTPGKSGRIRSARLCLRRLKNLPEPGKRSLVLGANGFGNLSGIIGSELFRASYAPRYLVPFFVTLGLVIVSMIGYVAYIFLLMAVDRWRARKTQDWTEAQFEEERISQKRYGDKKYTFVYGL